MRIDRVEMLNTGGGCMVVLFEIEGSSLIKSITINEEWIVAWKRSQENMEFEIEGVVWEIDNWSDLSENIGAEMARELYRRFKEEWKWPDAKEGSVA
jgi:hypothetical protein